MLYTCNYMGNHVEGPRDYSRHDRTGASAMRDIAHSLFVDAMDDLSGVGSKFGFPYRDRYIVLDFDSPRDRRDYSYVNLVSYISRDDFFQNPSLSKDPTVFETRFSGEMSHIIKDVLNFLRQLPKRAVGRSL